MQGSFDFATLFASEENARLKNDSAKRDWLLRDNGFLGSEERGSGQNDRGKGTTGERDANRERRYAGA